MQWTKTDAVGHWTPASRVHNWIRSGSTAVVRARIIDVDQRVDTAVISCSSFVAHRRADRGVFQAQIVRNSSRGRYLVAAYAGNTRPVSSHQGEQRRQVLPPRRVEDPVAEARRNVRCGVR